MTCLNIFLFSSGGKIQREGTTEYNGAVRKNYKIRPRPGILDRLATMQTCYKIWLTAKFDKESSADGASTVRIVATQI